MRLIFISVAGVAHATVVHFSELSGAVIPLKIDGANVWFSLQLGFSASGFHDSTKCPPLVKCIETPQPLHHDTWELEPGPNPAWSFGGSSWFGVPAKTQNDSIFGLIELTRNQEHGDDFKSARLLDTAGFVGMGPHSQYALSNPFRLLRFTGNQNWITLLPGQEPLDKVSTCVTVPILGYRGGWFMHATIEIGERVLSYSIVDVAIDFQARETRVPKSLLDAASMILTPVDAFGKSYVACSQMESGKRSKLRMWFAGNRSIFVPVREIIQDGSCRTNILADSETTVRVGYGFFETYAEIMFNARAGTVSFRVYAHDPVLLTPIGGFTPVPTYKRHPVEYKGNEVVFRFTPNTDMTEPRYVLKSLEVEETRDIRFTALWHPGSPRDVIDENPILQRYGPLTVETREDSSVVLKARMIPKGDFKYIVETSESASVIRALQIKPCPICFEDLTGRPDEIAFGSCRHRGHIECMRRWASVKYPPKCPMCRAQFAL